MKIEITGSNKEQMINLLNNFPNGTIEVEKENAYWVIENNSTPQQPQQQPQQKLNQPKGNVFMNMFDSLANRF